MINQDKWINSLPKTNTEFNNTTIQLDHDRWTDTLAKKNTYNTVNTVKKYSFMAFLFVFGLLFVSAVKNETRNLQKKINNLEASINAVKFNLDQAIIDNEVITSPENISLLAEEYLNIDLVPYKRSQIKQLNDKTTKFSKINKKEKEKINKKKIKNLTADIKTQVAKKIEKRRTEIKKLQALYYNPKSIPDELRNQVSKKIEKKKVELKNIYTAPKNILTLKRAGKWTIVQVVKLFLGMPIIPGR